MVNTQAIVAKKRGWCIGLGVVLIVLGVVSMLFPVVTTITAKIFLGWMFLIGGVLQVIHAFSTKSWSGFLWNLLTGILYVVVGGWLAFFPLAGLIGLTVLVAIMFIVEGVIKGRLAMAIGADEGRLWLIVSAIASVVLGVMLFAGLPSTALWAIGLLVGINFLITGVVFVSMANRAV